MLKIANVSRWFISRREAHVAGARIARTAGIRFAVRPAQVGDVVPVYLRTPGQPAALARMGLSLGPSVDTYAPQARVVRAGTADARVYDDIGYCREHGFHPRAGTCWKGC